MYYTTTPRTDGFGAQFQNIIADILYTYHNTSNQYVFPNIASFEHNYTKDSGFTERLVRYMNLRNRYTLPPNIDRRELKYLNMSVTYSFFECNITQLLKSQTMAEIKSLFYADKNTPFDTQYYNVAVQIRRFNCEDTRMAGADTPHSYYIGLMNHIRKTHPADKKPLRFHIYSQTTSTDTEAVFKDKYITSNPANDTELHLNGDVLPTFHGMVFADTLICSGSSFSYCAAFLTNGVVYYKQFWHKPADFWMIGDNIRSS
jgi:hypothetical protein